MKTQFLLAVLCGLAVLAAGTSEETKSEAAVESNTATIDHEESEDEIDSSKLRDETEKIVADVIANMLTTQDDEEMEDDDVDSELANDPRFLRLRYRYRFRPYGYGFGGLYRPFGFGYGGLYRPFGYGFGYRRRFFFDGANSDETSPTSHDDETFDEDEAELEDDVEGLLNEFDDLREYVEDDESAEDPQRRIRIRIRFGGRRYGRYWDGDESDEIEMDKEELEEILNDIIDEELAGEEMEDPQRGYGGRRRGGYGGRRGGFGGRRGGFGGRRGGFGGRRGGFGGRRGGFGGRRWYDEIDGEDDETAEDPQRRRYCIVFRGRRICYSSSRRGDEVDKIEMDKEELEEILNDITNEELADEEMQDPQRGYGGRRGGYGGRRGGYGGRRGYDEIDGEDDETAEDPQRRRFCIFIRGRRRCFPSPWRGDEVGENLSEEMEDPTPLLWRGGWGGGWGGRRRGGWGGRWGGGWGRRWGGGWGGYGRWPGYGGWGGRFRFRGRF